MDGGGGRRRMDGASGDREPSASTATNQQIRERMNLSERMINDSPR